jgi:O-antigen/teichoic acid export membrane protein
MPGRFFPNMPEPLKQKVISGILWRGLERIGTQIVSFVVSIVLARLLEPKDFGTITLITVFIALSQVFVLAGFGMALVQKKDVTEADYNSVFYLSLSVAVFLYFVLFFSAPWIAAFYKEPVLIGVLRLLSLTLILGALDSVQYAVLNREMKFKLSFKVSLIAIVVSGLIGVGMAYCGYGVWALVASALSGQIATTITLWLVISWRPTWMFSFSAIRQLFRFSSKLLVSALLDTFFNNLYNLIIGRLFNPTILGYYSRGQSIPNLMMTSVNGTISGVIFPALASCQHDLERVKDITRKAVKATCFLTLPMMFGLAAVSKAFVLVLLTAKWLPCVPYLQLSCITFAFWPLHTANLQVLTALGRSDIFLLLEIIKKSLIVLIIAATFKLGVMAMVIGQAVMSVICVVINAWPNRRLIDYTIPRQMADIAPSFLLSAGMGTAVWLLGQIIANPYLQLSSQILLGVAIYLAGAKLFRIEIAGYLGQLGRQAVMGKLGRALK